MADEELSRVSAVSLSDSIRSRRISAVEAVNASLETIERLDGDIHAFITVCPEAAREEAARLDDLAGRGEFLGPLHGIPIGVKDLVATKGIRTTKGSLRHVHDIPETDDLVVARLKDAGAVIVGKTNTPEFGFGALCRNEIAGNTKNPYAQDRSSGGSSGGSAAAVATGMVALAHGEDFGGSVRTPASFCNVVGFRPSAGLVPRVPKGPPWDTLLAHGVLARSVEDAALMLQVMAGGDPRDPATLYAPPLDEILLPPVDSTAIRINFSTDLGIAEIDSEVATVFAQKCNVISEEFPNTGNGCPDFEGAQDCFGTLRAALLFHDLGPLLDADDPPLSETVRWNVARGADIYAYQFIAAETVRGDIYRRCVSFFQNVDVLVTVSASVPPFPLDQENVEVINSKPTRNIIDYLAITYVISLVGLPAISIPAGKTPEGLPVGIQLIAGPGQDRKLLEVAAHMERVLGFRHEFP